MNNHDLSIYEQYEVVVVVGPVDKWIGGTDVRGQPSISRIVSLVKQQLVIAGRFQPRSLYSWAVEASLKHFTLSPSKCG